MTNQQNQTESSDALLPEMVKTQHLNRLRETLAQKRQQEEALLAAEARAQHSRAAQKATVMKQQTASVDLLEVCKLFVAEAITFVRATYYDGQAVPDTDNIDLATERNASAVLSDKIDTAISLGHLDFSYLSPLRDQVSLAFNRATIAMTRPPESRTKETKFLRYDDDYEVRRPFDDSETRGIYSEVIVTVGRALKKVDEKLQGPLHSKKRFATQTPTIPAKPK